MCSRDLIITLRATCTKLRLNAQVRWTISSLGLQCLRRGCRAGRHVHRRSNCVTATETTSGNSPIGSARLRDDASSCPVRRPADGCGQAIRTIITSWWKRTDYSMLRRCPSVIIANEESRRRRAAVRVEVPLVQLISRSFKFGVLNVRSLGNSSAAVHDCIVGERFDVMVSVESWHDSGTSPSVIATTPTGYKVYERARPRTDDDQLTMRTNHGGICLFVRSNIRAKSAFTSSYRTFEVLPLFISHNALAVVVVAVYRPGSQPVTNEFFDELTDVLERSSLYARCVIVGDINLHLDDAKSAHATKFRSVLNDFGMVDHVCQPTHKDGHQLDVFISRHDHPVSALRVDPPEMLSDHSLIVATFKTVSVFQNAVQRPRVTRRRWRQLNVDDFASDLQQSELVNNPSADVEALFDCYNSTLSSLLDEHAPEVTVTLYARPSAPWFDTECHLTKVKT